MKFRLFLFIAVLLGIVVFLVPYVILRSQVRQDNFKSNVETWVGDVINAKVRIGKIKVKLPGKLSISDIEILSKSEQDTAYNINVSHITFRYSWLQLLGQKLRLPTDMELNSPQIDLRPDESPYSIFKHLPMDPSQARGASLTLNGGQVSLELPGTQQGLEFKDIKGTFRPKGVDIWEVDFLSETSGVIEGSVHVRGTMDAAKKEHDLILELATVSLNPSIQLPFRDITGKVNWDHEGIQFDDLQAKVKGWDARLTGSAGVEEGAPYVNLYSELGRGAEESFLGFKANLKTGDLSGRWSLLRGVETGFEGNIMKIGGQVLIQDFKLDNGYVGRGQISFRNGDSRFDFQKGNQRFSLDTNLKDLHFNLRLHLDHMEFMGLDLVTVMSVKLTPLETEWEARSWRYHGDFKTEYFILEYTPFDDLQGSFEVNRNGIQNIRSSWGKKFKLTGQLDYQPGQSQIRTVTQVDGFDLVDVKEFAAKPLPKDIGGLVEGKLKIQGDLQKPEVIGEFSVKDGKIGKLEYDRMMIRFRGYAPYLPLYDSRALKDRTTLLITGVIDLSLPNILHGVKIKTPDKIVIWRGLELTIGDKELGMELHHPILAHLPKLSITAGMEDETPGTPETDKTFQDERYVAVGPKVKF